MDFALSPTAQDARDRVRDFIRDHILPVEEDYLRSLRGLDDPFVVLPIIDELKAKARAVGLWNLFLPSRGGLRVVDYATVAEEMGRSFIAPEIFNCNAPDTGNMEVLEMFGTQEQKDR